MPVPTRAHSRARRSSRRLGTAALLGLAACNGVQGVNGPICVFRGSRLPKLPLDPPPPPLPPPTRHGIVSGFLRRDTLGTAPVGTAWLNVVGPSNAALHNPVEGSYVPTGPDGYFRMRYVVGFGVASPDSLVLDLVAERRDTGKLTSQRLLVRRPRLLGEPPDSAVIAIVFEP